MKKNLISHYLVITSLFFILNNIVLVDLKVKGIAYFLLFILILILNIWILFYYKRKIKYKILTIIGYTFLFLFSKNIYYILFSLSTIIILVVTEIDHHKFFVFYTAFMSILIFYTPISFFLLLILPFDFSQGIYEDMHYYCDNNYEVYTYSAGAMDSFHYSIDKYKKIIKIDGIIFIYYSKKNEVDVDQYEEFLANHTCRLVGDKSESK